VLAVLQFDAVSVPLVKRLLADGRMPTLAELRSRGRWLELETPATHFPAGTYATLYSGLGIADHGMIYSSLWVPAEQRVRWRGSFTPPIAVWERLAAGGKRALVVDPYETQPPRALRGVALSGWQFVNVMSLLPWSTPGSARRELTGVFGRARRLEEVFGRPTVRSLIALRRLLLSATSRVADASIHLIRRERFDLVWVNFLAAHLGGHMLWDLSQIDAERLEEATRVTLENALTDLYEEIDHGLGRIVAVLPDDADVIVTSPMGMGENFSRVDLLPGMLEAVLSGNGPAPARRAESRAERFLWQLRASVPTPVRAQISAALHGPLTREVTMRLSTLGVDWSRTPAFLLPSDHFGQVRLNVRGREREGIVDPRRADEVVDDIRSGLLSFRDPDGEPSVLAVDRVSEVIGEGARTESLPDLVVRWSERPSAGVDFVSSPDHGHVQRLGTGSGRSGAHLPQAWALVVPGRSKVAEQAEHDLVDLAPTVCAVLGIDPAGLPGSPLLTDG
jgi:predicted AlkP superfamily phosphohydrolase/phosphomutase